ncbi:MAG: DUF1294 domain-containing protein [Clostridia bacterium]|nr:DUF1294 domain-containing protein [Clostridia bacterium]
MRYLEIYICLINVVAIIVCIVDKIKAQRKQWRISEKTLFSLAAIGGAFGMYLTMIIIRHKTKHRSFMVALPFMFLVHGTLLLLFLQRNA